MVDRLNTHLGYERRQDTSYDTVDDSNSPDDGVLFVSRSDKLSVYR